MGMAFDPAGNLYIADWGNGRIRKVSTNGIISTVAGGGTPSANSGDGGPATAARLNAAYGVALDSAGNLYIVEEGVYGDVRKVTSDGTITTVAGSRYLFGTLGDGRPATSAFLYLRKMSPSTARAICTSPTHLIIGYGKYRMELSQQ